MKTEKLLTRTEWRKLEAEERAKAKSTPAFIFRTVINASAKKKSDRVIIYQLPVIRRTRTIVEVRDQHGWKSAINRGHIDFNSNNFSTLERAKTHIAARLKTELHWATDQLKKQQAKARNAADLANNSEAVIARASKKIVVIKESPPND